MRNGTAFGQATETQQVAKDQWLTDNQVPETALRRWGEDAGARLFWDIGPAVDMLDGADDDEGADGRRAIAGNVEVGDIAPAIDGRWQQAQKGEVLDAADASDDRAGTLHQRVLGGRARDAELENNLATRDGGDQLGDRVGAEGGLGGRKVEQGQAEVRALAVNAHEQAEAVKGHLPAACGDDVPAGRGQGPGHLLFEREYAPAAGDGGKVAAVELLVRGPWIARRSVSPHDLTVTAVDIDDRTDAPRLGRTYYLAHDVCQAGLSARWVTPPPGERLLNPGRTSPVECRASTILSCVGKPKHGLQPITTRHGFEVDRPEAVNYSANALLWLMD